MRTRPMILMALLWALLLAGSLRAQGPAAAPVLRLETGMHTAPIRRIGADAANRWLVTASHDKTARVWDLATGRLLRVLRPPLGEGNEGKLNAVAISPDGATVAVGGWTKAETGSHNIYLFDRESGRMLRRLEGLENVVFHLVFSRDGRWLAATLGDGGLRVWATGDYRLIGADREYGADSYGADFDVAGRLVSACDDGFLRLYQVEGTGLRLLHKARTQDGKQPFDVKFSPDGARIAAGFIDTTRVSVFSGRDLSPLYSPDTSGVDNGNLGRVAWSVDGRVLYAGGRYAKNGLIIRRWSDGGRGGYAEAVAADSTIMQILPLRAGGIVFGASDPAWGVIDAAGQRTRFVTSAIPDYRGILDRFLLSRDGGAVQFGYESFGKSPARFSLADRRLEAEPKESAGLLPPRTTGLTVTDWEDKYDPKLDGRVLSLDQNEISRSLAIAPGNASFLLGADFGLRLFDRTGKQLWRADIPGVAWSVNISGDERLAVAAFADGTIRWHRLSDGKELLAFFPHKDRQRWVLWTPGGYYDCSAGAEELIGWHVNNGKDAAADFYPASRFRSTYYRPDVIDLVLKTLDEQKAVEQANAVANRRREEDLLRKLPPVVEILSPREGESVSTTTLSVRIGVRAPSGEAVTGLRAFVDGRPVSQERGQSVSAGKILQVSIPERDCEISVIAENRFAASTPARVRIRWAGRAQTRQEILKPTLYVLAIGVGAYADPSLTLDFPAKDARDFTAAMLAQKGGLYADVVFKTFTDAQATKNEILDGLDWIRKETTNDDVAMVFLAGHGTTDTDGSYYFLPTDVDEQRLFRTGVRYSDIETAVRSIAGKALFFVDTCHAGRVTAGRPRARNLPDISALVNELASAENGAVVFAAAGKRQDSLEDARWGNGAFTKALVEGLNGAADLERNGRITVDLLSAYVTRRVKELTGGRQTPGMNKPETVPDFPIAIKR